MIQNSHEFTLLWQSVNIDKGTYIINQELKTSKTSGIRLLFDTYVIMRKNREENDKINVWT